jgi:hypothetical protein
MLDVAVAIQYVTQMRKAQCGMRLQRLLLLLLVLCLLMLILLLLVVAGYWQLSSCIRVSMSHAPKSTGCADTCRMLLCAYIAHSTGTVRS